MPKLKPLLLLLLAGLPAGVSALPKVQEFTLDNGLKILVREDRRAPVVVAQIWYKVGSSYEPAGLTGISHALEHLMFRGTPAVGPGEFARIISANGGSQNAFTSRDYTAYFEKLAKDRLEISLRLEADRMRHLLLDKEAVARELQIVAEERRLRTEDAPESLTFEQFNAVAFITHPYRQPVIGWMEDILALDGEDLRRWYSQWYAPNNATLVVVGDVDPQQVLELAKRYFGPLPSSEIPVLRPPIEVPQPGERRVVVQAPAELPYVILGYKVPVLRTAEQDWEPYALQVLAGILDAGNSSRLSRHLVRGSQVAATAGAGYNLNARLDDLFILAGNPAPGRDSAELEQALRAQVQRLREERVSAEELSRVLAQVIAAEVYQLDSLFYQAMRLGVLETVGLGWRAMDSYVERIKAVTPEQIQAVARKYLSDERLTVATLLPLPLEGKRPAAAAAGMSDIVH